MSAYDMKPEFVITIPPDYDSQLAKKVGARITLGVIIQLIAQAKKYLIISAPFIQRAVSEDNYDFSIALTCAQERGVNISILSTSAGLEAFNNVFSQSRAGSITLYQPRVNVTNENMLGSHAKFCLADGEHAYIGSANLTGPGLYGHLEMGVLVHGEMAKQIELFWDILIEIGFLSKIN